MYKIADYHREELEGTFYEQELQNIIKKDSDFYRIEKLLKEEQLKEEPKLSLEYQPYVQKRVPIFLYVFGLILIVSLQMFKKHSLMASNKSLSAALMIALRI